jgi:DNA-directed RNA polymerase subunit RPC12/RpoP
MSYRIRYRCLNCGEHFEATILTDEEVREAQERRERLCAVHCPKCNRTDVEKGW